MQLYKQALLKILDWSYTKPYTANKGAAQVYVQAMPQAEEEGRMFYNSEAKGRRTQLVYILSNLQYWRGETATEVKTIIKEQIKLDANG